MILDEELSSSKFVRVHDTKQHLLHGLDGEVLSVKLWSHGTPHLCTLDPDNTSYEIKFKSKYIHFLLPSYSINPQIKNAKYLEHFY